MTGFWQQLKQRIGQEATDREPEDEADALHFAAAALLIEMCESDMDTDERELQRVRDSLKGIYGIEESELDQIIAKARRRSVKDVSYYPHVTAINELCSPEQKQQLVEELWKVAYADGRLDKYEEHYLRRLCELIHVPHRKFMQARHQVESDQSV